MGKSSLLNALVGRRRLARTSGSPGKTRASNVFRIDDRWYVVDLPGYGYARVSKADRAAFRRLLADILRTRERLAGVTWLLDIRHAPSTDDRAMADLLAEHGVPVLVALTKADKLPFGKRLAHQRKLAAAVDVPEDQCLITSAEKHLGITELREAIEHVVEAA